MKIQDLSIRGFVAGVMGSIVEMVFTLMMYYSGISKYRFMDFAGIITFNHRPDGILEMIIAEASVWIFCGVLAVGFVYLIKAISTRSIIFKGVIYGISSWFLIYGIVTIFRIDGLYPSDFPTSATHLLGGLIYGMSMAYSFIYLTGRVNIEETGRVHTHITQPAMKPLDQDQEQSESDH